MSRKGKSRTRNARVNLIKANERNTRRKARQQHHNRQATVPYNIKKYDGCTKNEDE